METAIVNLCEDENVCPYCEEIINNGKVKNCDCKKLECPICGEVAWEGEFSLAYLSCGHLLAGKENDEFVVSLLERFDFPVLDINTELSKYTDTELLKIFGESYPLLKAYNQNLSSELNENELWEVLTQLVSGLEVSNFYDQPPAARIGWEADMLCAKEPLAANKRIVQLIDLFSEKINLLRLGKR
jgi:hypothetical protein